MPPHYGRLGSLANWPVRKWPLGAVDLHAARAKSLASLAERHVRTGLLAKVVTWVTSSASARQALWRLTSDMRRLTMNAFTTIHLVKGTELTDLPPPRRLVCRWTIDAASGRPVCAWSAGVVEMPTLPPR